MKIQYEKLHFYGQRPEERIILLVRRHWFIPLKFVSLFVFLFILLPVVYIFLPTTVKEFLSIDFIYLFVVLGASIYYLIIWLYFFTVWINYYFDTWIVTNERIINIEQKALFKRIISEQQILRVQDVTSEIIGMIPTFLDFGNVYIQTAGTEERFIFEEVPHPNEIKRVVLSVSQEATKSQQKSVLPNQGDFGRI